ncbi:hypothetical protein Sp245p_26355 (plasmid) [Azospirillum baldaniorum]|uniref:hypothetical protein n=1 Tax=Azospirillum baldaniorum TaxID=1064539 RepID=UPI0005A06A7F|nr:hypothetical protein [Azospirillum baldaniorum]AWJ92640.1 hypothetical protein Sp245p_22565 [Azospirillum baldaniorum]AWJ93346.1 hypothetical protein Sp245p_26355 [Azospirillum baldaniorum]
MTYAELIQAINASRREPGGCTPPVVDAVRAGGEEARLSVNAILGWEIRHGRRAGPGDEASVMEARAALIDNMAPERKAG